MVAGDNHEGADRGRCVLDRLVDPVLGQTALFQAVVDVGFREALRQDETRRTVVRHCLPRAQNAVADVGLHGPSTGAEHGDQGKRRGQECHMTQFVFLSVGACSSTELHL